MPRAIRSTQWRVPASVFSPRVRRVRGFVLAVASGLASDPQAALSPRRQGGPDLAPPIGDERCPVGVARGLKGERLDLWLMSSPDLDWGD